MLIGMMIIQENYSMNKMKTICYLVGSFVFAVVLYWAMKIPVSLSFGIASVGMLTIEVSKTTKLRYSILYILLVIVNSILIYAESGYSLLPGFWGSAGGCIVGLMIFKYKKKKQDEKKTFY